MTDFVPHVPAILCLWALAARQSVCPTMGFPESPSSTSVEENGPFIPVLPVERVHTGGW